ncbi:MAG: hypothetical protein HYV36_07555 [Lentisphaerae bacterium]|nr:hypothetical protein [Lentisphaerota bacterium]
MNNRINKSAADWFPGLVLALLSGALATRVYGAWCLRYNLNPDAGVVALMVKHMAEGRDFPVFFYGQPYMGSFEPLISAALCRLFGVSGLLVCLGTAALGFLTLPVIYRWARDLDSSRSAGIAALAFLLVGPGGYFHYQISPRGGYAATLFFGTLVLWLSGRGIVRSAQGSPPSAVWFFLLGLLAGLGWWSNQLITAALLTAALLVVLLVSFRLIVRRFFFVLAGFALGSWPFWWWNATHQWASFGFRETFGQRPIWEGLALFFLERFPDLLDLADAPLAQYLLLGAIYSAAAVITAGVTLRAARQHRLSGSVFALMLFSFVLVSALIFSTSYFAEMRSPRYLLPLVPVTAVMVGVMTARLQAWLPRALASLAWLPLLILIFFQFPALRWAGQRARGEEAYQRQIESVGAFLEERGVEAAYIPYSLYAWHFALREAVLLSELSLDRYPSYSRQAELASRIAVFGNAGGLGEFLRAYGGSAQLARPGGVAVHVDFAPPGLTPRLAPMVTAEKIVDSKGRDARKLTTDGNLDTWWESAAAEDEDEWIEIQFLNPERVGLIRLLCFPEYPPELQVEGREPGGAWRPLTPVLPESSYFWSGPRPYCGDWLYRLNIVLAPVTVEALRLRRIGVKFGIRELLLFAPDEPATTTEAQAFLELARLVQERDINRLYCDRWVANALHRTVGESIQVPLEPAIFKGVSGRLGAEIRLTPHTGILVRREDAALCQKVLAERLVVMRKTAVGPWLLLDFDAARWSDSAADELGLQWSGFACFLTRNKLWAATLARRSDSCFLNGEKDKALDLLFRAAREYPDYHPVTERLAWYLEALGRSHEAADWRGKSARLASPETAAEIRFHNGVTFRGITLSSRQLRPGAPLTIRYYWQFPTKPLPKLPRVFVHFQLVPRPAGGERSLFQDDHFLPRSAAADDQPLPEIFCQERTVQAPADLPEGKYTVEIGLFLPGEPEARGQRIRADTSLSGKRNAFILPVTLEVIAR